MRSPCVRELVVQTRARSVRSACVWARVCGKAVRLVCCVRRAFVSVSVASALRSVAVASA
eukprot:8401879-Lingulodinium_polyedra.AAC.1